MMLMINSFAVTANTSISLFILTRRTPKIETKFSKFVKATINISDISQTGYSGVTNLEVRIPKRNSKITTFVNNLDKVNSKSGIMV